MSKNKDNIREELEEKWNDDAEQFQDEMIEQFCEIKTKELKSYKMHVRATFEVEVTIIAEDEDEAETLAEHSLMVQDYSNGSCGFEADWVDVDSGGSDSAISVDDMSVTSWRDEEGGYQPQLEDSEYKTLYRCEDDDEDDTDSWFETEDEAKENWAMCHCEDYKEDYFESVIEKSNSKKQ